MGALSSYNNIGATLLELGQRERGAEMLQKALAIREAGLNPGDPRLIGPIHNLALLYEQMGEYERALELHERARAIEIVSMGPQHPEVVQTFIAMGNVLREQSRFAESIDAYEQGIAARGEDVEDDARLGMTLAVLGVMLTEAGRERDAESAFARADSIAASPALSDAERTMVRQNLARARAGGKVSTSPSQ